MKRQSSKDYSKSSWQQVLGTITKSEVVFDWEDYRPVVEYTYEVDGITYTGNKIVSGLITFNWKGPAMRMVKQFPVGARVSVFVDPAYPQRATLQMGMDKNFPVFLICFIGLLLLFFVFAWLNR